jgi:hypothetical protein
MLEMLKIDLGITGDVYNERLGQYLETARKQIEREGVTLTDDVDDSQLTVTYAAWLWRRRDNMQGMPRMLRYLLNNRIFAEKMGESG